MRKLIAITQVTLDGVMQGPGGRKEDPSHGFKLGGWAMPFIDEAARKVVLGTIADKFDLLLGRRTYEIWNGYWPHHDDNPIGKAFNRATKHVVTRKLKKLDWEKSERVDGDVVKAIRRLKKSKGPVLHAWGSGELLQTLVGAGLVDEHRLWVIPIVLGEGKKLFGPGMPPRKFKLISSSSTPSGVVMNVYRPGK